MKILKYLMIIFLLLPLPTYSYAATFGSLRISLIAGDVQVITEDTGEWVPASINMPLGEGDRIWVPEGGRTELQLRDGSFLRLDEESALEVLTLEENSFQFYLTEGYVYANFRGVRGSLLQIDTRISSIRAYEKSNFRVDVARDGYTDISVYAGSVNAENREGITRVYAGKTLSLREGTYAELFPLGPPDEWERWNMDRDRRFIAQRPPSRYLPDELYAYSSDFENNGRWVYAGEYGYVWRPIVVVGAGWAPYRVGRWVWMHGDYVWISYEPWGWVPYHYGRWAHVASMGWCWVPPVRGAVYWGPGFVGWVRTPTYVSWVPLAPREIYYGHGNYGPHSINITNINITNIQVQKVVYKNVHVQNAVTVVHYDTFVKGKPVEVKIKENPFLKEKISIGRPNIKPEKATVMPMIKEIPQTKRPPEPIREIKVRELKQERPLVREKETSVLKPESPPKPMPFKVKEGKPIERDEKIRGSRPTEKGPEKLREGKPVEGEKTKDYRPSEKGVGKPGEFKPKEKEGKSTQTDLEKSKQYQPTESGVEKFKESKPTEKDLGRSKEFRPQEFKQPEKGGEKPKEFKPAEKGLEKLQESRPSEKDQPRIKEFKPAEKGTEKIREHKEEKGAETLIEQRPVERGGERPREPNQMDERMEKKSK